MRAPTAMTETATTVQPSHHTGNVWGAAGVGLCAGGGGSRRGGGRGAGACARARACAVKRTLRKRQARIRTHSRRIPPHRWSLEMPTCAGKNAIQYDTHRRRRLFICLLPVWDRLLRLRGAAVPASSAAAARAYMQRFVRLLLRWRGTRPSRSRRVGCGTTPRFSRVDPTATHTPRLP